MKVFNLCCSHHHRFEGWFGSDAQRLEQLSQGLLVCPLCGDSQIQVLPSAPHVQVGRAAPNASRVNAVSVDAPGDLPKSNQKTESLLQAAWIQAVQLLIKNTDDVGEQFADEARRIHYGEAPDRGIRGSATPDEAQALQEEGIDVVPISIPESVKGSVH